jgi:hypothetical protein
MPDHYTGKLIKGEVDWYTPDDGPKKFYDYSRRVIVGTIIYLIVSGLILYICILFDLIIDLEKVDPVTYFEGFLSES